MNRQPLITRRDGFVFCRLAYMSPLPWGEG